MIRFEASPWMTGVRNAIFRDDRVVVVSPALFSLLRSEKDDDLVRLLESIKIIEIPWGIFPMSKKPETFVLETGETMVLERQSQAAEAAKGE